MTEFSFSLIYGFDKAAFFLDQPLSRVFHQHLGIGAGVGGDLPKLRLLLGRKMHFHAA